jgi:hypothetical protein
MDLAEARNKAQEASELIPDIPMAYSTSALSLPGVGIGVSPDNKEYRLVFQLASANDSDLVTWLCKKIGVRDQTNKHIEITGEAFSLPGNEADLENCRRRPLTIGTYISPLNIPGGTLGCFVRKITHPQDLFILSCTHVLTSSNETLPGDLIVQPGGSDSNVDEIARLDNFISLSDNINTPLDAAIAKITCQQTLENITRNLHHPIALKGDYAEDEIQSLINRKVIKIGSKTDTTFGWITSCEIKNSIRYRTHGGIFRTYRNLITIDSKDPSGHNERNTNNSFSAPGDSGSLIYCEDGYAVGLLIGGTTAGLTYALPIEPILNRLGIKLILS